MKGKSKEIKRRKGTKKEGKKMHFKIKTLMIKLLDKNYIRSSSGVYKSNI